MARRFDVDASLCNNSMFRLEKITEKDLPLFRRLGIKDWNGKDFDEDILLKHGKWVVNDDKSVIFKALGGGAFEIPEMYDLIYKAKRIRLECGGGAAPARIFLKHDDQTYDQTVFVSHIRIPQELSHEQDSVLAVAVEAFAIYSLMSSTPGKLTVEFNL